MKRLIIKFSSLIILASFIIINPFVPPSSTINANSSKYTELSVANGQTWRASVASNDAQGNGNSIQPSLSADGRYVAFSSGASNLVSGDTNEIFDIFVKDLETGQIELVSVSSNGIQADHEYMGSEHPSISANGRYVAFMSWASNLVSGDTNNFCSYIDEYQYDDDCADIFVHDRVTGQTERVSVSSNGVQSNHNSYFPSISADGRYVAFVSLASNLVEGDTNNYCQDIIGIPYTNNCKDIFVHDRLTGQTERVSVSSAGVEGNTSSVEPSISGDGRYVAFSSRANNLVVGDSGTMTDVFIHDRQTGLTQRVSVASDGTQGNRESFTPSVSTDGRFVSFVSWATNMVDGDTNGVNDVFVHDRLTGLTQRVSVASDGTQGNNHSDDPSISADGRYVAFGSWSSNLVSNDTNYYCANDNPYDNNCYDKFVHDRLTGETFRVSVSSNGTQGNNDSGYGWGLSSQAISADGQIIAFYSLANNLVFGDTNDFVDVFIHRREGGIDSFSISGRVVDVNNNPISGVSISDSMGHTSNTDSNGYYNFQDIQSSNYIIIPSKSGYLFSPSSRAISVPPNKSSIDFVGIKQSTNPCEIPFFSQRDDRWKEHPLRSNGICSSYCNKIGTCGCTLTSAAMLFSYFGTNSTPPTLSDCMGISSCPFYWSIAEGCSMGMAQWDGRYSFSWERLNQIVNKENHPVILGMHLKSDMNKTHWIVVTRGEGTNPENYLIHDPWFLDGQDMKLSSRYEHYNFDWISVYTGTPVCSLLSNSVTEKKSSPISNHHLDDNSDLDVTGYVQILRLNDTTMKVQFIAQSTLGTVTEMMIWTDNGSNPVWQPLRTLVELPVNAKIYAQFKDEFGNQSAISSDSIFPEFTPERQLFEIYLPAIISK